MMNYEPYKTIHSMKKNLFFHLPAVLILAICIVSCSKEETDYTNAIPLDATLVVGFNLGTLAEKAGGNDPGNQVIIRQLAEAMRSGMDAATFEQMETVMEDPMLSGIDLKSPAYIFSSPAFESALVTKVDDEGKLQRLLEISEKEQISTPVSEENGCRFVTFNSRAVLAFNSTAMIVTGYTPSSRLEKIKSDMAAALAQTAEKGISANAGFQSMRETGSDIAFYVTFDAIPKEYKALITTKLPDGFSPEDFAVLGGLMFEEGRVTLNVKGYADTPDGKELLEQQGKASRPMKNTYLKYFPESTLALLCAGVDGGMLSEILQDNTGLQKAIPAGQANLLKQLLGSLQDDVTLGFIDFSLTKQPSFLAYAGIKNGDALKALHEGKATLGLKRGEDIVRLSDNEYVYKSRPLSIFYGIRDGMVYATNDESLLKDIGKPADPAATETDYASDLNGKEGALIINVGAICRLPAVRMLAGLGRGEVATYLSLCEKIDYIEGTTGKEIATITLQLQDRGTNALKQMADIAKETIMAGK